MGRQLYRVYLYTVSIALLVLAAVGLGVLLSTLFAYTPLRGSFRLEPTQQELVQSLVFAVTAWIIAGALGALHLRLIRRDIAEYAEAGGGVVRSFFLNGAEAVGILVAVFTGANAFSGLAYADQYSAGDATVPFAVAIASLLLVIVLELERRRHRPAPGAAMVFQQLHQFGVPLILLIVTVLAYWGVAMRTTVARVLMDTKIYTPLDLNACGPGQFNPAEGPCSLPSPGFLWLATLIPIIAVAVYAWMARDDLRSSIRTVTHIGSLSVGVIAALFGLVGGIELGLRALFGLPVSWSDIAHPWYAQYDFISPITIGVLLIVAYGLWIRAEKAQLPPGAQVTDLVTEAVAATIFAGAFFWGIGSIAYATYQWIGGVGAASMAAQWASAIALTVGGLAYIPLAIHLRLTTGRTKVSAPRRGFVLALLAGGTVTGAVGLTITLYTLGTNILGAPVGDWEQTVRGGLAALTVGVILVVAYGLAAAQEHSIKGLFNRLKEATAIPKTATGPLPAPETVTSEMANVTASIEQTLKEYEAHTIGLREATERIQSLMRAGPRAEQAELTHA